MTFHAGDKKYRLDDLLVLRGLCPNRSQAKALIMAGKVQSGTHVLDKPGKQLPQDAPVSIKKAPRFVGRGGEKLERYLEHFSISMEHKTVLDVGASTGGFSDCALQRGALSVTCVDVGHGQLHDKLRRDPRVTNLEKINARHLRAENLPHPEYDFVVMDLSFISLRLVLPVVWPFVRPGGKLIALVKPQFEATREEANRGRGVIKDPEVQERIAKEIRDFALAELPGATLIGIIDSPIYGATGNREFLLGLKKKEE